MTNITRKTIGEHLRFMILADFKPIIFAFLVDLTRINFADLTPGIFPDLIFNMVADMPLQMYLQ